eukprot:CAMPEP_0201093586 /NCGR_PEP_ID=MMETSP0812-20130820/2049_1 /ASSEMBLY_ACC=CAM_ASM_000668 /TAXON_ID=98059 /ORGANISM="Dinobryon sp., Strain UTEXLB2267" /LENGTH=52 /DNA_ID=CAMNT_0047345805 /DNA_START=34 /DNA_END=192 /DNA_ORIENTATION=+
MLINCPNLGSSGQQQPDHFWMTFSCRRMQRGFTMLIKSLYLGPSSQQQADHF